LNRWRLSGNREVGVDISLGSGPVANRLDSVRSRATEAAADIDALAMNIRIAGAMTAQVSHSIRDALSGAERSRLTVEQAQHHAAAVADQIAALAQWLPDPDDRDRVLRRTPAKLFDLGDAS